MNELQKVGHWLYDLDLNTTAIATGKKPGHTWENWQTERQTLDDVNRLPWRSAVGVGVISGIGGFREFDFDDCPDFAPVATALDVLGLPSDYRWLWRSGSGRGYGLAVICHDALPSGVLAANGSGPGVFKAQGRDFDHLELRWERCQTIIPPSKHPAGPGYKWLHGAPTERPAIIRASQAIGAFLAVTVPKERKPAATAPAPRQTGDGYGAAALRDELDTLNRAAEGARNDSLNRAAYNLGQLVAGGELNRADVESQLLAVALRIGLGERESLATIASGLDAGSHEPRTAPNLIDHFIAEHLAHDLGPGAVPAEPDWPDFMPQDEPAFMSNPDSGAHPSVKANPKGGNLAECPALPDAAQLDPALGLDASPWLNAYIEFSRTWAPRAYDGFHEAVGLGVLSTVAARRVVVHLGKSRYTNLYIASTARSSVWTKSTAHDIGADTIKAAGLVFLLAPDESTPQAMIARMARCAVVNWDALSLEDQEIAKLRLAFAGQKGWLYDEFGHQVNGMMRDSGPMADFRGILRRWDDCPDKYEYETIARGSAFIRRPYLTLLAAMTPADMAPYAKAGGALWRDGFWARFAFVAPHPAERSGMGQFPTGQRVIPAALLAALRGWHDRLGVPEVQVTERVEDGDKPPKTRSWDVRVAPTVPHTCELGPGVFAAFYAYHDALANIAAAATHPDLDGNYSRFAEKALRVAALLASLETGDVIHMAHWARAQAITERWRASLHNLYLTLTTGLGDEDRTEDRVLEIVKRLGTATPSDVHRELRKLPTTEAASMLRRLVQAGALVQDKETRKGTLAYKLHESCKN